MILHDYECNACRRISEAMVDPSEQFIACPVCRVGKAERVYLRMSSMPGKNKGLYPRFDTQLGITLESSQHMERVAKERGLAIMGNQEWERSRNAPRTPNPMDSDEPDPQLIEIAKKAWDDVKYDRVPIEREQDIAMTMGKASLDADVLSVTDAPKTSGV